CGQLSSTASAFSPTKAHKKPHIIGLVIISLRSSLDGFLLSIRETSVVRRGSAPISQKVGIWPSTPTLRRGADLRYLRLGSRHTSLNLDCRAEQIGDVRATMRDDDGSPLGPPPSGRTHGAIGKRCGVTQDLA